jgi:hypothetical protein
MSLCYDFQKWTVITMLAILTVCLTGMLNLVYGQTLQQDALKFLLDYCFQHADRPNPIQDLIDKGLISSSFNGYNCLTVRQEYDRIVGSEARMQAYIECARRESSTYEECSAIKEGVIK